MNITTLMILRTRTHRMNLMPYKGIMKQNVKQNVM